MVDVGRRLACCTQPAWRQLTMSQPPAVLHVRGAASSFSAFLASTCPAALPTVQAKKILTNLGELEDTNRPLLTLSPAQLRALLEVQGIDVRHKGLQPAWFGGWCFGKRRGNRSQAASVPFPPCEVPSPPCHVGSSHGLSA